jgi:hypothetical protein
MKADFIFRTTRTVQLLIGIYLLVLAAISLFGGAGAQIVDWEVRNRLLMGVLFIFPHLNLKWMLQPIYLLLLIGGTLYFFGPMAIAFNNPGVFPIGIIILLVVLLNVYFTLGIWAKNMNNQVSKNENTKNKNIKGSGKKKK